MSGSLDVASCFVPVDANQHDHGKRYNLLGHAKAIKVLAHVVLCGEGIVQIEAAEALESLSRQLCEILGYEGDPVS